MTLIKEAKRNLQQQDIINQYEAGNQSLLMRGDSQVLMRGDSTLKDRSSVSFNN